jgi:hypothetical protein
LYREFTRVGSGKVPDAKTLGWPLLDEDLAIGPLLKSVNPRAAKPIKALNVSGSNG